MTAMRTEIKTLTFAVVHFSVAFSVGYLLTGSLVLGSLLALVEPAVNTVAFYLHERVWAYLGRDQDAPLGVVSDPHLGYRCATIR